MFYAAILLVYSNLAPYKILNVWDFIQAAHKPISDPLMGGFDKTAYQRGTTRSAADLFDDLNAKERIPSKQKLTTFTDGIFISRTKYLF